MISQQLTERIEQLEKELARLKALAANPPGLPDGFIVATVHDLDTSQIDAEANVPPEAGTFVVVPEGIGDRVNLFAYHGGPVMAFPAGKWDGPGFIRTDWCYGYWGSSPEEAIDAFFKKGGVDAWKAFVK